MWKCTFMEGTNKQYQSKPCGYFIIVSFKIGTKRFNKNLHARISPVANFDLFFPISWQVGGDKLDEIVTGKQTVWERTMKSFHIREKVSHCSFKKAERGEKNEFNDAQNLQQAHKSRIIKTGKQMFPKMIHLWKKCSQRFDILFPILTFLSNVLKLKLVDLL